MQNAVAPTQDHLLTEAQAAEIIGFSKNTLRAWRVTGRPGGHPPPPYKKIGRAVRYPLSTLNAWMSDQVTLRTTSEGVCYET